MKKQWHMRRVEGQLANLVHSNDLEGEVYEDGEVWADAEGIDKWVAFHRMDDRLSGPEEQG